MVGARFGMLIRGSVVLRASNTTPRPKKATEGSWY